MIKTFTNIDGRRSGIYKIVHIPTGKTYIGSTILFHKRFLEHKRLLNCNKHCNIFLQNTFNKNPNMTMEILEIVEAHNLLVEVEQKYIDLFFDNGKKCFNLCPKAGNMLGYNHTEKTKKKFKQLWIDEKTKTIRLKAAFKKRLEFTILSPNNIEYTHKGIEEFAKIHNISTSKLLDVVTKKSIHCKGWRLIENKDYDWKNSVSNSNKSKKSKFYNVKLINDTTKETFGPIINLAEFCRQNNLDNAALHRVLKGKNLSHKNWKLYKDVTKWE